MAEQNEDKSDDISELQMRVAFQEDMIASLNEQVSKQEQEIDLLQKQLQHLYTKMASLANSLDEPGGDEAPPPHY
ncbi:MAG: SlyX family protein [Agarilytica sp.]